MPQGKMSRKVKDRVKINSMKAWHPKPRIYLYVNLIVSEFKEQIN